MVDLTRLHRRTFIRKTGIGLAVLGVAGPSILSSCKGKEKTEEKEEAEKTEEAVEKSVPYTGQLKLSLAQWSHHKEYASGLLDPLNFAELARGYGLEAIEYVSQFYVGKATDKVYLNELNLRANDNGVYQHLIMVDNEGDLASPDAAKRADAIQKHHKWVDAASFLGCKSIRVNVFGDGTPEQVQAAAVDSLGQLTDYARDSNINILVENHGGYSSNGNWLAGIMRQVNKPNVGTLPDFGNFCLTRNANGDCTDEYDRYVGVEELMPFAKAVSAKSFDFDQFGTEKTINYERMIDIIKGANYSGYIGIEYEGERLRAEEGIVATKKLLERYI